jgi:peroxiredoxin
MVVIATACANAEESGRVSPTGEVPTPVSTGSENTAQPTESTNDSALLAPIFSVSTIDGENIRLEDLLGSVPVYLIFIPGTTDDLDKSQMGRVQSQIERFEEVDAEVVVVVSDLPTRVIEMRDELGLEFPLIADPLHVVASDWQVFDLDNDGKSNPASFVFDAHGGLIARLVAAEPDDRPSIEEVLSVIEESLSAGTA